MTELPGFDILISAFNNEPYDDTSTHSSNSDTASRHVSDSDSEAPEAEIDPQPRTPSHSPDMETAQIPADIVALMPAEKKCSWIYELPPDRKKVTAILGLPQRLIAIGMDDGTIEIWDPDIKHHKTAACIKRLVGHSNTIMSLSVTPRCELLSASSDCTVIIWNMAAIPDYPISPANKLINLCKKQHTP
ncbi:hypothetical protein GCM10023116_24270 [Kistimonas scapharcae]|uniref:Uncharacterized protein n=2 Tax=Kistimonas scapharcae TaxID=1036133 RepID=A0ABP8V421_9GAMM